MKLHGVPQSNFYNMAKQSLLEKGAAFEEVLTPPSQDESFLALSPMGKIPLLETDEGPLTEAPAIMEYLETKYPANPLYPAEPYARARVIQIMRIMELYVEAPVHPLVGKWFGRDVPDHVVANARPAAEKGLAALERITSFAPYIAGDSFTFADIVAFHCLTLGNRLTMQYLDWNMLDAIPGLNTWYQMLSERDSTSRILADIAAAS